ncbi:MAG: S8 family serine peptidase [Parvularculaceae bacterium]|nr:S8 family serine peptidase [Parvularculaceae bacterium]
MTRLERLIVLSAALALAAATSALAASGSGKSGDGKVEDKIDQKVESKVEDSAQKKLEQKVDDNVRSSVETKIDEKVSEGVSARIESGVEDRSGKRLDTRTEDRTEQTIEARVDRSGSDAADKAAERKAKAELDATEKALDAAHRAALDAAREAFDAAVAAGADQEAAKIAYDAQKDSADSGYDASRDAARAAYELSRGESASSSGQSGGGGSSNSGPGSSSSGSGSNGSGGSGDDCKHDETDCQGASAGAPRFFEDGRDERGRRIARGEWLMLASADEAEALRRRGFETFEVDPLPALNAVLLRVRARSGMRLAEAEREIRRAAPGASVDYNHVYASNASPRASRNGDAPSSLMRIEGAKGARIGVIDTAVDLAHPALAGSSVVAKDFVPYENHRPTAHGTGVVSILAGQAGDFRGVAPEAKVYEASVFFSPSTGDTAATASSIVRALDWLAAEHVLVVNMSLAGPPNDILRDALGRAQSRGMIIVAAVGNEGPSAPPQYPAAYEGVVGVTAVARDKRVWRLAGRGPQVDFAAPGVDILHADGAGYAASSGTSMAAPFVAAAVAAARLKRDGDVVERLARTAEDLGATGRDIIYGDGFINPDR